MIRLRQLLDKVKHRLLFIPILGVLIAIGTAQAMLVIDAALGDQTLPELLLTTVDSGRAILSAIAGGLIASVTLLLSMMLVAIQLASSQFSPRTVRNWIGDRTQQIAIAVVLGTTVYCLLILRETRTFEEGEALTPHLSVIVAVVLGILSLIAVVRSVDHLTNRLRVGSVASGIMAETVAIIGRDERLAPVENPTMTPSAVPTGSEQQTDPPSNAFAIEAPSPGWVQQIHMKTIINSTPEGSTVYVTAAVGSFTFPDAPVAWVWPRPDDEELCSSGVLSGFAFGDGRTMQQDIGFGVLQMVDIALRALSPGVNDPNTANDLIVHLGVTMLALWERPIAPHVRDEDGRKVVRFDLEHAEYLHAAFDPIRLYGAADPSVAGTMLRTLAALHTETRRRELAGPLGPIEEVIDQILDAVDKSDLSDYDKATVRHLVPAELTSATAN